MTSNAAESYKRTKANVNQSNSIANPNKNEMICDAVLATQGLPTARGGEERACDLREMS